MLWLAGPVAIPLARYQAPLLQNNERLIAAQNALFSSEQEMANANPQMILERAPQISLPSLLVHQGTKDDDVPHRHLGGRAALRTLKLHTFVTKDPSTAESLEVLREICEFAMKRAPEFERTAAQDSVAAAIQRLDEKIGNGLTFSAYGTYR